MVKSCPIVEWSVIRMPFKYQTKFNPMFKWWSEYQNYNLNTRQVKHCYSVIQMFVIQIPTVYNPWNSFVALGIIVHSTLNLKRFSHQSMLQSSAAGIWCRTLLYCYEMYVWSSYVFKTPLQKRACSMFTSQLFCIAIISCSLTLKERIPCVHSLCFIARAACYD